MCLGRSKSSPSGKSLHDPLFSTGNLFYSNLEKGKSCLQTNTPKCPTLMTASSVRHSKSWFCFASCSLLPWEVKWLWQLQHYGLFCCDLCVETQAEWPAPKCSVQGGRNPSHYQHCQFLREPLVCQKLLHHEQVPQSLLAPSWGRPLLKHTMRRKISLMVQKSTGTAVLSELGNRAGLWHGAGLVEWSAVREAAGAHCIGWMM